MCSRTVVYVCIAYFLVTITEKSYGCDEKCVTDMKNRIWVRVYGKALNDFDIFRVDDKDKVFKSKNFDSKKPTLFYYHGWTESPEKESAQTIISAYINKSSSNIIVFDFRTIVDKVAHGEVYPEESNESVLQHILGYFRSKTVTVGYFQACENATTIGLILGNYTAQLVEAGLPLETIHVMGHSLGGQIISFVGKAFNQYFTPNRTLPRITALDPAGPYYILPGTINLEPSDAELVDVIHTDYVLGYNFDMGDADFYPNSGAINQPGCYEALCSHQRSWRFYAESVANPKAFPAIECTNGYDYHMNRCDIKNATGDIAFMGYALDKTAKGRYYLVTTSMAPYGH